MGRGDFKKPLEGPKIGPTLKYDDLSEDRKRELGDLAKTAADAVFKPAALDPRVAQTEPVKAPQPPSETPPPAADFDVGVHTNDAVTNAAAEQLEALQSVLQAEAVPTAEEELRKRAAPTDEDKQEFLRCVLGGRRYTKSYKLFGGSLKVVFADLTPRNEEEIFAELSKAQTAGVIVTEDDWALMFDRLRMVHSVIEFTRGGEVITNRDCEQSALDKVTYSQIEEYMSRYGTTTIYRAVLQASRLFRTHMEIVLEASLDSDFWIVGGPDSLSPPIAVES
jgi:hypothetical protein